MMPYASSPHDLHTIIRERFLERYLWLPAPLLALFLPFDLMSPPTLVHRIGLVSDLAVVLAFAILYAFRRFFSYSARTAILMTGLFLVGLTTLLESRTSGPALLALAFPVVYTTLLWGTRPGAWTLAAALGSMALMATLDFFGALPGVRAGPAGWIVGGIGIGGSSGFFLLIYGPIREAFMLVLRIQNERTEQLQQSELRFRELADLLPVIVVELDLKGVLTYANRAAFEQTGYTEEDFVQGFAGIRLFAPEQHPRLQQSIGRILGERSRLANEYIGVRKDGSRFEILTCSAPLLRDGRPVGIRSALFDVTRQRETERALARAERYAAIGTIAGGVAHQFNNILAPVFGYAGMLQADPALPEASRRQAAAIARSCERARGITRTLSAYVSNEPSRKSRCRLSAVLEEAQSLVEEGFRAAGVDFRTELVEDAEVLAHLPEIAGQALYQILFNAEHAVLGNAEKRIRLRAGVRDGQAYFEVEDNGPGIPPEIRMHLFTPFFTSKGEFARRGDPQAAVRGVGLGLCVAQKIVEQHSGEIEVGGEPGRGAKFSLRLPLAPPEVRVEAKTAGPAETGTPRILVVEDEADIRDLFAQIFQWAGWPCELTDDGREALVRLGKERFDLLLLDLQMPKVPGSGVLELLDGLPADRRPTVLVVTGRLLQLEPAVREALAKSGVSVLEKPFEPDELLGRIRQLLAARRA